MVVRHQEGSLLRKAEQPSLELSTSTEPPIAIGNTFQLAVQTLSDAAPISCQLLHLLLLTSALPAINFCTKWHYQLMCAKLSEKEHFLQSLG